MNGSAYAGLEEERHAVCWRPLPLRAELVRAGDVVILKDGTPVLVVNAEPGSRFTDDKVVLELQAAAGRQRWRVAPDRPVKILVPEAERTALLELRRQLGASITDRTPGSTT